ncbi:DEAD/DEAH box helicase [Opitutales bacterium]|nr:DEAD/DEAH box helicase [Opitutales bacterium]
MDIFEYRKKLVGDYGSYLKSFIKISDKRISSYVDKELDKGALWPEPLLQLNPSFEQGRSIDELVSEKILHEKCGKIFRTGKSETDAIGKKLHLHKHQDEAIQKAQSNSSYVLTTGTGSGKSLSYIIPIVDHVLKSGSGEGIKAIVVYPMNALANSQNDELKKFLKFGFERDGMPVTFKTYTGQEGVNARESIKNNPPDILLTNYVMLELILTRVDELALVRQSKGLRFLVFDELHTYRGRQGADVGMLIRRARQSFEGKDMLCVGTSATMASDGDTESQRGIVANVSTKIFGSEVKKENVVIESLKRRTEELDFTEFSVRNSVKSFIESSTPLSNEYEELKKSPFASWVESTFGIENEVSTGRLIRKTPLSISGERGVISKLSEITTASSQQIEERIKAFLLASSVARGPNNFPLFAFRFHQFMTRGDTVWGSLEKEDMRKLTLRGQQFVPGTDRKVRFYPMVFCRCCGQEYYRVTCSTEEKPEALEPRLDFRKIVDEDREPLYLYFSSENPWPEDSDEIIERVPDEWLEEAPDGSPRVIRSRRDNLPEIHKVSLDGHLEQDGITVAVIRDNFMFCLNPNCRVTYNARINSDISKLSTLGIDGRSTATSIMALSVIQKLRHDEVLKSDAKKVLSFTDNRQDASLQAGHFNDFVEVAFLRSSLYKAMENAGTGGLDFETVDFDLQRAMDLPAEAYANDPEIRGPALDETKRALREVLKYLIFLDLRRGWRLTSPNLEQCGLLKIQYKAIDEFIEDKELWKEQNAHPLLINASDSLVKEISFVLLDLLRKSLCIKTPSLEKTHQEKICTLSTARLQDPWVFDDQKKLELAGFAWPRSKFGRRRDDLFVSPQSGYGQFIRRVLGAHYEEKISMDDTSQIIRDLLNCMSKYGLVERVREPGSVQGADCPGYQIPASVFIWTKGDGIPPGDPLRITHASEEEQESNEFFKQFYIGFSEVGVGLRGREHTAQVAPEDRVQRENDFKKGTLALMFCSPTMELGVDIAQLNVVNMRNVPPTPANYAQRSGRAGRGGQPALVYTYCSGLSPHDQYYFQRPERMVAGTVSAPRIDLANEDLILSHIHAIWLSFAQLSLGKTLVEVLRVSEEDLALPLQERVSAKLHDPYLRKKTFNVSKELLSSMGEYFTDCNWYGDEWLERVIEQIPKSFDSACNRWRSLYKTAIQQRNQQHSVIVEHNRPTHERNLAKTLRKQAETQIELLTNAKNAMEGDFYSYRYFASEGFLPGYNFPRLPLSAFIPSRRGKRGKDEFLSRPRFLAVSEFGPQALIYHEGAQYRINKVNLSFEEEGGAMEKFSMKVCSECGYGHMIDLTGNQDTCSNCGAEMDSKCEVRNMIRLQNVSTMRLNRITSDEEERQRLGYNLATCYDFPEVNGVKSFISAEIRSTDQTLGEVKYGDAANIWRINMGWARSRHKGFQLDPETGRWGPRHQTNNEANDQTQSTYTETVVPYVEDKRNLLVFSLVHDPGNQAMASLQAALKQAIQQVYQLEPSELAVESLPNPSSRKVLSFYEAAEGGAGVLRQVVTDPSAVSKIARVALELCHYDPDTGEDLGPQVRNGEGCEAACYDCLLDYGNQRDHRELDRSLIKDLLLFLSKSQVSMNAGVLSRESHVSKLYEMCDSKLEKKWLKLVEERNHRLPDEAQKLLSEHFTKPDFFYTESFAAIYVDGPPHDDPDQKKKDEEITVKLKNAGFQVIRFHHRDDWLAILDKYPSLFGTASNL